MARKTNKTNIILIVILIIIVLVLIVYLFVPFLNNNFLRKTFSPFCGVKKLYQGEEYLPAWCIDNTNIEQVPEENLNLNTNVNNTNTNEPVGLANPAAVKCEEDGGTLEAYITEEGADALCVFGDDSICNEWDYFRGDCQPGECFKECRASGTKNEGWYNSCTGQRIKLEACEEEEVDSPEEDEEIFDSSVTEMKAFVVESPQPNEQLSSPFTVKITTFQFADPVYIRVKSLTGTVLIEETANFINDPDSNGQIIEYDIEYEFSQTKEGYVEVYALDGEEESSLISVPVKF